MAPALTDHLLQLVIVPVDGPGQGARVLGHDGSTALCPPSNSLTSLLSSPRLSPPPTAAAATPPISSRTTTGPNSAWVRGHRGAERRGLGAAGARSSGEPRLLLLCVRHSPARSKSRPRPPLQQRQELRLGPAPLSRPPPQPHARAKLSLHLPTRSALTSPRRSRPAFGPRPLCRHLKCGWVNSEQARSPRRWKLTVHGKEYLMSFAVISESQRRV